MEKRLRLDLLLAVCALLLSGVASIASVYQAHVIAQQFNVTQRQFNASVWPYMTLTTSVTSTTIQLTLTNDGLGPAIIRSASIEWDGKKSFASWRDMATTLAMLPPRPKLQPDMSIDGNTSSLDPGEVVRASASRVLFSLHGWNGFPTMIARNAVRHALTVSICYCSLLDTCWMEKWNARPPTSSQDVEPHEARSCPAPHGVAG